MRTITSKNLILDLLRVAVSRLVTAELLESDERGLYRLAPRALPLGQLVEEPGRACCARRCASQPSRTSPARTEMHYYGNTNQPAENLPASARFVSGIVNVTQRCNLRCSHCNVYREGNPNEVRDEPTDEEILDQLDRLRRKHRMIRMLWIGGEPLIKKDLLHKGLRLFRHNIITTNGTISLVDFSRDTRDLKYVVSLDGPETVNDAIRGAGVFARVMKNIEKVPRDFPHLVQAQCTVTRRNQDCLRDLLDAIKDSRFDHIAFSFYIPSKGDRSEHAWRSLSERDEAIRKVMALKEIYYGLVRNRRRSLERMLSENDPKTITDRCLPSRHLLGLYLDGHRFVTPFCCYGNEVDCDRCGAWITFELEERRRELRLYGLLSRAWYFSGLESAVARFTRERGQ